MEKTILNQVLKLDTAPVHVAPGGSSECILCGNVKTIGDFLRELREEIAFGMINAEMKGAEVEVSIYYGLADEADVDAILLRHDISQKSRMCLAEDLQKTGMTMQSRNKVIDLLR